MILDIEQKAVWSIQQQLLRDDAFIIGTYNADPRDHARAAAVSASSEQANGTASNIISGQSRAVVTGSAHTTIGHGGGLPASQAKNGTTLGKTCRLKPIPRRNPSTTVLGFHILGILPFCEAWVAETLNSHVSPTGAGTNRWISQGLPAAISLALASPVAVKQVQLVFDTGMHRTLSYSVVHKTNNPVSTWGPSLPERAEGLDRPVYLFSVYTYAGVATLCCFSAWEP